MRVLLIYPRALRDISDWADHGALTEPLALGYIAQAAKLDGHEAKIIDLRLHEYSEYAETLESWQPDVVGVTGYSMHVLRCLEICQTAKDILPKVTTIIGGHHATLEPIDFFEPQIDFVVGGEGTLPFRQIMKRLGGGKKQLRGLQLIDQDDGIPGVHEQRGGKFVHGGPSKAFDIDDIPPPDRSLNGDDREKYNLDWMSPLALARTSVGCPYRCSFCALWRIMDGRYYTREVTRVAEEFKAIKEKYVLIVDDEAFVNKQRMTELARQLEKSGVDKNYFAYCRLDTLTRETDLMKRWRDIGLSRLLIGVETVFDWELKEYNKRQSRESILVGLEAADKLGLRLMCNFVIHPNYGDQEFEGVIEFIDEYNLEYPSFTVWTPIPATVNYNEIELTKRQSNGRPNWDYFDLNHAVIKTKLPEEEFHNRFEDLYWRYISKYGAAAGESRVITPTEQSRNKHKAALGRAYEALARKALSTPARSP